MAVYVSNIVIEQGFFFDVSFQLGDTRTNSFLDLRGTTAVGQLKKTYTSLSYVNFLCSILEPENGLISLSLTDEDTRLLKPGRYVYDIKILSSAGQAFKAVEGSALVRPGVTT
jgi:hypothetical protein